MTSKGCVIDVALGAFIGITELTLTNKLRFLKLRFLSRTIMASAKKTEIFNFSTQQIYDVITDFDAYSEFLPEVKASKVIKDNGSTKVVEMSVSMIKDFTYTILVTLEEGKGLSWVLNDGDVFKTNIGSWTLNKISDNQTEVTYEVGATFKIFVPSMISKKMIEVSLPKMLQSYKDRIKKLNS